MFAKRAVYSVKIAIKIVML